MRIFITQNKFFRKTIIAVIWLTIWQWLYFAVGKEILIVSPFGVAKTLYRLIFELNFWTTVGKSLLRVVLGYSGAVVLGVGVAIITSYIPFGYDFFYPIISAIKATPVASFTILSLVWLDTGKVPVFMSFLMVFPIIWGNICEAIKSVDIKFLEMAYIYKFGRWKKIKLIYIPTIMPYFIAGCTTGIGLAWKSGIAAEVISTPKFSIGGQLHNAKVYLEMADLFGWTVVVVVLSIILERIIVKIIKRWGTY